MSYEYFDRIDELGGVIPALKNGFFQSEISNAAYTYQQEEDNKDRITVGVNEYLSEDRIDIPILRVDSAGEARQIANLNHIRETRDNELVRQKLIGLKRAAIEDTNLMPPLIEAVKAYATLGEMMGILREVFGEYQPTWNF